MQSALQESIDLKKELIKLKKQDAIMQRYDGLLPPHVVIQLPQIIEQAKSHPENIYRVDPDVIEKYKASRKLSDSKTLDKE